MLRDERGWVPSNYVAFISDKGAELAFVSGISDRQPNGIGADNNSVLEMNHAMMLGVRVGNEGWLGAEPVAHEGA
jgi:hypothetical protein